MYGSREAARVGSAVCGWVGTRRKVAGGQGEGSAMAGQAMNHGPAGRHMGWEDWARGGRPEAFLGSGKSKPGCTFWRSSEKWVLWEIVWQAR